jgi:hypothetical protein
MSAQEPKGFVEFAAMKRERVDKGVAFFVLMNGY